MTAAHLGQGYISLHLRGPQICASEIAGANLSSWIRLAQLRDRDKDLHSNSPWSAHPWACPLSVLLSPCSVPLLPSPHPCQTPMLAKPGQCRSNLPEVCVASLGGTAACTGPEPPSAVQMSLTANVLPGWAKASTRINCRVHLEHVCI